MRSSRGLWPLLGILLCTSALGQNAEEESQAASVHASQENATDPARTFPEHVQEQEEQDRQKDMIFSWNKDEVFEEEDYIE